jgi:8-hydroxy-5-deazaflavin:NADPH oxidoreductase
MKVTIIGAGNMGRGIATRLLAGRIAVELIDRNPDDARLLAEELGGSATASDRVHGEIVVLALPYDGVATAIEQHRSALDGKIVVDIANPADWATMDRLVTPEGSSSAEEAAKLLPEATRVVKAFNTTFAPTLVAGEAAGQQLDVLIAGDDEDAKKQVATLVEAGGMRPVDVGPLKRARQLEQMGMFHIAIQDQLGSAFGSALKLHT